MRIIKQAEGAECGLACIAMVAHHHGLKADLAWFRERFPTSLRGATVMQLHDIATALGFSAQALKVDLEEVKHLARPCILHWQMKHFVVLAKVGRTRVTILDPAGSKKEMSWDEFSRSFTGIALELLPGPDFRGGDHRVKPRLGPVMGKLQAVTAPAIQILALAIVLELFGAVLPLFGKWFMDDVLPSGDTDLFLMLVVAQCLLLAFRASTQYLRIRALNYLTAHVTLQWGVNLVRKLLRLPVSYFEKRSLGDINSRLTSYATVTRTLTSGTIELLLDGAMGLLYVFALAWISPAMAAICGGFLLLYLMLKAATSRALQERQTETLAASAHVQTHLLETIRGIAPIRLNGAEPSRLATYEHLLVKELNRSSAFQMFASKIGLGNFVINGARDVAVTALGIYLVLQGVLSLGAYVAIAAYSAMFCQRAITLIDKITELKMLRVHLERIGDITLTPPEFPDAPRTDHPAAEPPRIEFRNVSFRYAAGEPFVLQHVSFTIGRNEAVAITGASGIGKTTLMKLILGIYHPTSGDILVDGVPLQVFGIERLRAMTGTVLQDDSLFTGSIADNIAFFDEACDMERVHASARLASIHDEISALPMKYHTRIGDMGSALSGGQKQRVILARALYRRPQLILLDEATSHLDSGNEDLVNAAMASVKATRLIIAHRASTISKADRAIDLGASSEERIVA